jgi:hypothetical protein
MHAMLPTPPDISTGYAGTLRDSLKSRVNFRAAWTRRMHDIVARILGMAETRPVRASARDGTVGTYRHSGDIAV